MLGKRWACECAHHQPRPQDLSLGRVLASSSRSPSLSCLSRILFVSLRVPVSLCFCSWISLSYCLSVSLTFFESPFLLSLPACLCLLLFFSCLFFYTSLCFSFSSLSISLCISCFLSLSHCSFIPPSSSYLP